jgi:ABC-type Fe3+/spermidine/putrescine transport system ATPase subunit
MSYFAIHDLSVALRQFRLRGVGLAVEQGQTLVLLGPSGSGKSVLLETIAGFHSPARGRIELAGREITHLPPEARGLGFMFQDYALFPHLTVEQNIAFGLGGGRWESRRNGNGNSRAGNGAGDGGSHGASHDAARRVEEVLSLVGASHLAGRRPAGLSGGEKQRVALARAMAIRPRLFLFDEPLSALDAVMRDQLRDEMRRQLRSLGATSLYVTHDRQEALMLADTIAIVENGAIRQCGPAAELFAHPADAWVAEFLGMQVLCPLPDGRITGSDGRVRMRVGDGVLEVAVNGSPLPEVPRLVFRPEDVRLEGLSGEELGAAGSHGGSDNAGKDGRLSPSGLRCAVEAVVPMGPLYRIDLHSAAGGCDARFHALLLRAELQRIGVRSGDRVFATVRPEDLVVVPEGPTIAVTSNG